MKKNCDPSQIICIKCERTVLKDRAYSKHRRNFTRRQTMGCEIPEDVDLKIYPCFKKFKKEKNMK